MPLYYPNPLPVSNGGTGANLSATGGANQFLKQSTAGGALTVGQPSVADLSDGTTGSGPVVRQTSPTLVTPALGTPSALTLTNATGLPRAGGGTGVTTLAAEQAALAIGIYAVSITGVNFNSATTDNAIAIPTLPTGFTRIVGFRAQITNASASLTTATYEVRTATGGGGTALVTAGTITVSSTSDATANNAQNNNMASNISVVVANTTPANTLQFRIVTPQGSAATGDVTLFYFIAP